MAYTEKEYLSVEAELLSTFAREYGMMEILRKLRYIYGEGRTANIMMREAIKQKFHYQGKALKEQKKEIKALRKRVDRLSQLSFVFD